MTTSPPSSSSSSTTAYTTTPPIDFTTPLNPTAPSGLVVLITGGASGIGLGIAAALVAAGAHVTVADIHPEGESIVAELRGRVVKPRSGGHGGGDGGTGAIGGNGDGDGVGGSVTFIHTDVTSWEAQARAFKCAVGTTARGTVDLVIPCAGVTGHSVVGMVGVLPKREGKQDVEEGKEEEEPPVPATGTLDVNLMGVYYTMNLALWYFARGAKKEEAKKEEEEKGVGAGQRRRRKHILFMSSLAGYLELPLVADYQAAKFGVRGLWKAIRGKGEMFGGMRANLVAPTFIRTQMVKGFEEDLEKSGVLLGEVEDVVKGVMRCVCDESIDSRALAITANDRSFDLCDDWEGHDGGRELLAHLKSGALGDGMTSLIKISGRRKRPDEV